jgi:RNA polymerase nonessential primary-like sigma factor
VNSTYLYIKEINRYPRLTAADEIVLGKKVQKYLQLERQLRQSNNQLEREMDRAPSFEAIAKLSRLSPGQIRQIIEEGKDAKKKMIECNLRLVASIARKYTSDNLTLLDLIQEGTLGLIDAIDKFDPTKGYRFSTYAYWWIRQSITRAIYRLDRAIRLPLKISEKLTKIRRAYQAIRGEGEEPTVNNVAKRLGLKVEEVRVLLDRSQTSKPISLETKNGLSKPRATESMLDNPMSELEWHVEVVELETILEEYLTKREEEILRRIYGFNCQEQSLNEIAAKFDITAERVRQIKNKAIEKIKVKIDREEV